MLVMLALLVLPLILCLRYSTSLSLMVLWREHHSAPPPRLRPDALPPRPPVPPLLPPPPPFFLQCGFPLLFPRFFLSLFYGHLLLY